jgi:predicted ABC-type ATPase
MAQSARSSPRCIIIAGPNGAGKTTFAREFLTKEAGVLSPLRPELAALSAGRLFLQELDRLAKSRKKFAFESTLSGVTFLSRLKRWKAAGYRIEIVYLRIASPRRRSRSGVSLLESSKVATTCRERMFCAVSREAGSISKIRIDF